jgi:hypothetical protein
MFFSTLTFASDAKGIPRKANNIQITVNFILFY